MLVRSVLMDIKVPGTKNPLFLICKGVMPTGREQEAKAEKVTHHAASFAIYRMMFKIMVDPSDIAEFVQCRFSIEHAKVTI